MGRLTALFVLIMLSKGSLAFRKCFQKVPLHCFLAQSWLMGRASLNPEGVVQLLGHFLGVSLSSGGTASVGKVDSMQALVIKTFSPVRRGNDVFPWEWEEELHNRRPLWSSSAACFDGIHKSSWQKSYLSFWQRQSLKQTPSLAFYLMNSKWILR